VHCAWVAGAGSEEVLRTGWTNPMCNPREMVEGFFSAPISWSGLGLLGREYLVLK